MADPLNAVQIDVEVRDGSLDAIATTLEKAIVGGLRDAFAQLGKIINQGNQINKAVDAVSKAASKRVVDAQKLIAKEIKFTTAAQTEFGSSLNRSSHEAYNLNAALANIGRTVDEIKAAQSRARTSERQGAITDREIFSRDAQRRIEIIKGENSRAASAAQGLAQQQVVSARYAGKQRVLIVQEVLRTIGRLEKALGATISGIARTAVGGTSKVFSSFTSAVRRSNDTMTTGLSTNLRRRESLISESYLRQEKTVRASVLRQERQVNELRTLTSRGVLGAASGRGVGGGIGLGGLAGGAGIAGLLTLGFNRFSDLERINKQFIALTGSITDTNFLLDQVKAFAKETPFDLVGVADLAKGFLAIKTPVDQVLPRVRAIADAVALTGGGVDELNRIQRAIGQIVSTGKLQGDELNQLAENLPGLNIRQILADQLTGGNVAALVEMQEAGELGATAVVDGLIAGLANDPRLKGASGDLAKTLGGRVANLKESFADFGASIIGLVAAPLKVAVTGIQTALQGLSDFIKGEDLSKGLTVLRDGLAGAAIAMTAIIAAKGAVEVIKLLGVAVQLVLSPLGLLLVGAATVGAAFNILHDRSEDFREAIGGLGRYLRTQGGRIWEAITAAVERVSQAFRDTKEAVTGTADRFAREAKPASRFFRDLADDIKKGLFAATTFLTDKFIPALATVAIFIGKNFIPAVKAGIDVVAGLAQRVIDIAKGIYTYVKPGLQPAIDGFHELANAVGAAFGGDFSGLSSGATSALSGISNVVGGLVENVGKALAPIAQRIVTFFQDIFSKDSLKGYASAFLAFVEELGRVIALILTSPTFVKALAAIAAIAVVIGFRFIKGLGEGIIQNIPGLLDLLGDALGEGLELVFDNLFAVLGVAIAAALFGPRLFSLFRRSGAEAGQSFATGLKSTVQAGPGFVSGLFGGSGSAAAKAKATLQGELRSINAEMRALGGRRLALGFNVNEKSLERARGALGTVKAGFTEAEIAGRVFRQRVVDGFTAVGKGALGIGTALKGVGQVLTAPFKAAVQSGAFNQFGGLASKGYMEALREGLRAGGTSLKEGLKAPFTALQTFAKDQGVSTGRAFGQAIQTGAQVGLAAVGGFVAGRAAGESGSGAVFPALTAGLTGLALGGPLVGAVAAGASLIGSAFGGANREAKAFKEAVGQLTTSLKDELKQAVDDGVVSLEKIRLGLLGFGDIAGFDSVAAAFSKELGADGLKVIDSIGLTWEGNILPIIKQGGDIDVMKAKLRGLFTSSTGASKEFRDRFGDDAKEVQRLLGELLKPGGEGDQDFSTLFNSVTGDKDTRKRIKELLNDSGNEAFLTGFIDSADDLTRAIRAADGALDDLNVSGRVFAKPVQDTGPSTGRIFSDAKETYRTLAVDRDNFFNGSAVKAQGYADALVVAKSAFDSLFNISGVTSFTEAIDNAIIGVSGVGKQIADGLAEGTALAKAQAGRQLAGLADDFNAALSVGLETGAIKNTEGARAALQTVFDEAVKGLDPDSSTFAVIAAAFEEALSAITPLLTGIDATEAAAELLRQVNSVMKNLKVTLDVAANIVEVRMDAIGRQIINGTVTAGGMSVPPSVVVPPRDPIVNPRAGVPQSFSESDLARFSQIMSSSSTTRPIEINQTFNERVDTRAAAADIAWRLT